MAFHDHVFGLQGGQSGALPGHLRSLRHVDSVVGLRDVHGLMTHRGKNLPAEPLVARETGHSERLDEVPLRQSLHLKVVGLPSSELSEFGGSGEEVPSDVFRTPAIAQQRCDVGMKVLDDSGPNTSTSEPIVEYPERATRLADLLDIGHSDTPTALARR